jgi:hypothetical protein
VCMLIAILSRSDEFVYRTLVLPAHGHDGTQRDLGPATATRP